MATTLSRLRTLIGAGAIRRQAGNISIEDADCWVDCLDLKRLVDDGPHANADTQCKTIRHIYQGVFLQGEGDAPWMLPLREKLHVGLISHLSRCGAAALDRRQPEQAAELYELGLGLDDLVEAFYAGLIRCHQLSGLPSLAVSTYRRCRRALSNGLGVAPSDATSRLYLQAIDGAAKPE